ncbi:putative RNA methyltransferase [Arthrobacter psychrolactophilus]
MEITAVNALLCPHCGQGFSAPEQGGSSMSCLAGHSFDIARQGYVNLLTGSGTKFVPDSAEMVAARDTFLEAGHYQGLADALAEKVTAHLKSVHEDSTLIVDAGTGTGWYLQEVLAATAQAGQSPAAVGMDISKFALRRAARRNPEAVNIVWDLWRELPLGAGLADVVLVIFAPRNASEFARILKPGGTLLIVTPLPQHLGEIAADAGMLGIQEDKEAALVQSLAADFELVDSQELLLPLELSPADVAQVAFMGPAGHHATAEELAQRLTHLPEKTQATAAFRISAFSPRLHS